MNAKSIALLIGIVFVAVGFLGFIDNPIIGASENAMFYTDKVHNIVHIGSGALFILVALLAPTSAKGFLILFGLVYLALGVYGYMTMGKEDMAMLFGFLHVNGKDNFLHIGLGILILIAGMASRRSPAY